MTLTPADLEAIRTIVREEARAIHGRPLCEEKPTLGSQIDLATRRVLEVAMRPGGMLRPTLLRTESRSEEMGRRLPDDPDSFVSALCAPRPVALPSVTTPQGIPGEPVTAPLAHFRRLVLQCPWEFTAPAPAGDLDQSVPDLAHQSGPSAGGRTKSCRASASVSQGSPSALRAIAARIRFGLSALALRLSAWLQGSEGFETPPS